ncbi:MAG: NAD(P)/FAD-dependent oxidoreductase [Actinomycetota bacterium]
MAKRETADLVVVGGGAIGGWASVFAKETGAERILVIDRDVAGKGASSRAAGMVRSQGGSPDTVRLGTWSIDFYGRQRETYGFDSGFRGQGYVILAATRADQKAAADRIAMQQEQGLDVRWVDADEARRLSPTLAERGYRGGSYVATDGWLDPPTNVQAYLHAMHETGVEFRERTAFLGLRTKAGRGGSRIVTGVETSAGTISTGRVILAAGPGMQAVAKLAGGRAWVGYARHQVVVTQPHPDLAPEGFGAMIFDMRAGIYWRPEEGGLLWGMSNPHEAPGAARSIDWPYIRKMEKRLNMLVPITKDLGMRKVWAATIEYTPDHQPLLGPFVTEDGAEIRGATIASACGHGMMWGPAVARIASDLSLTGSTDVVERPDDFRMDRFDEHGNSPFVDPVALPFPILVDE